MTSKEIEPLILQILNSGRCKVVGDDGKFSKRALELCRSLSPSRFNDMLIVATAEKYGKLATYDKKLRSKAKELGIEVVGSG